MEIDGNIARLDQDDQDKLRSKIEADEVDALRLNERGEVTLVALRGLFYKYYPMGLATPYLESPITEMFQQVEEAMQKRKK